MEEVYASPGKRLNLRSMEVARGVAAKAFRRLVGVAGGTNETPDKNVWPFCSQLDRETVEGESIAFCEHRQVFVNVRISKPLLRANSI
jgi:hypothetical protein